MGSQLELYDEFMNQRDKLLQALPGVGAAQFTMIDEAYKDAALSRKVKRLMALAIALGAGCTACILAQTMRAVEAGATRNEILETIGVAMTIRGTTGMAESFRVIKLLKELGKL